MGNNAGPHLANIYLHIYEFNYIIEHLWHSNVDPKILLKLIDIFRFQDDLIVFNDDGHLQTILKEIYPQEMVVNNTNISPRKCSYLDLMISVFQGKFLFRLFDKRLSFSFKVISYPFLCGNSPKTASYGVFTSQLNRFCEVNCKFEHFLNDFNALTRKLCDQGFEHSELSRRFDRFYHSQMKLWSKFGKNLMGYKNTLLRIT